MTNVLLLDNKMVTQLEGFKQMPGCTKVGTMNKGKETWIAIEAKTLKSLMLLQMNALKVPNSVRVFLDFSGNSDVTVKEHAAWAKEMINCLKYSEVNVITTMVIPPNLVSMTENRRFQVDTDALEELAKTDHEALESYSMLQELTFGEIKMVLSNDKFPDIFNGVREIKFLEMNPVKKSALKRLLFQFFMSDSIVTSCIIKLPLAANKDTCGLCSEFLAEAARRYVHKYHVITDEAKEASHDYEVLSMCSETEFERGEWMFRKNIQDDLHDRFVIEKSGCNDGWKRPYSNTADDAVAELESTDELWSMKINHAERSFCVPFTHAAAMAHVLWKEEASEAFLLTKSLKLLILMTDEDAVEAEKRNEVLMYMRRHMKGDESDVVSIKDIDNENKILRKSLKDYYGSLSGNGALNARTNARNWFESKAETLPGCIRMSFKSHDDYLHYLNFFKEQGFETYGIMDQWTCRYEVVFTRTTG